MVMYSFSMNDPAKATIKSVRGLKADTNRGPFKHTHHANRAKHVPEASMPCKNKLETSVIC